MLEQKINLKYKRITYSVTKLKYDGQHEFEISYLHQGRLIGSRSDDNVGNVRSKTCHHHVWVIRQ